MMMMNHKKLLKKLNNQLMWKMLKFRNIVTSKTVKKKKHLDEEILNEEPLDEEALKPEDKTQVEK